MYRQNSFMPLGSLPMDMGYSHPTVDMIPEPKMNDMANIMYMLAQSGLSPYANRGNAIQQLMTDDVVPQRAASPQAQPSYSAPTMNAEQLRRYQEQTRMMEQGMGRQAPTTTRQAFDVEPVNIPKFDRQGNIIDEVLMYRDKRTGKLYLEDPNFQ